MRLFVETFKIGLENLTFKKRNFSLEALHEKFNDLEASCESFFNSSCTIILSLSHDLNQLILQYIK